MDLDLEPASAAQGPHPRGVSVVIATHGRPVEVDDAIRSVYAQHHDGPIEVIVVFDGEDPRPIPAPPSGFTVRALTNDRTRGLAGARNTGIMAASQSFVAFLDDDDQWLPDRLPAQLDLFGSHPECVMVGGSIEAVMANGVFIRHCPETIDHAMLLRHRITALHSCTFVLRTSALHGGLGLVDETLPGSFGEDYDLALRAARIAPLRAVPQPVARINWVGQSFFIDTWERNASATEYLLAKHDFSTSRAAESRMWAYVAYCRAAVGDRRTATSLALRSLRMSPTEKRALLALLVAWGLTTPERLASLAARLGRRW